ncbi:extensin family protein [Bradyrhizobium sp. dw_78]|uniref:extensin family protein n=1 Tax=Bradyrhizobium sp. dw_78 TaxID=2719793 RepID=UPI00201C7962|nr:extensin family protein [Bradyrhizobium sp. dw_78]
MVTVAALLLTVGAPSRPAVARKSGLPPWSGLFGMERPQSSRPRRAALVRPVPLPKPRPAEAPVVPEAPPAGKQAPAPGPEAASPPTPPAAPSACRLALTDMVAIAPSIPDIHGPGACGGEDLVRLEAVVLPDQRQVAVRPAAILRCTMASAIADWVRSDLSPQAASLGSPISSLDNLDSFECRGRNRVDGARLSEHGRANALDVRAFGLADGRSIALADRTVPRELRENVLHSVCTRFTTVLGPGSDGYHEDHVHLDLMERRNDYRICEWDVWDPLPQIAPLLPAARPDDAPPRAATAKPDTIKPDTAKPDAATSDGARPDIAASGPAEADPAKSDQVQPEQTKPDQIKSPTKKRR